MNKQNKTEIQKTDCQLPEAGEKRDVSNIGKGNKLQIEEWKLDVGAR